jgi:hypothetical protein
MLNDVKGEDKLKKQDMKIHPLVTCQVARPTYLNSLYLPLVPNVLFVRYLCTCDWTFGAFPQWSIFTALATLVDRDRDPSGSFSSGSCLSSYQSDTCLPYTEVGIYLELASATYRPRY